jgi:hypothetical protein
LGIHETCYRPLILEFRASEDPSYFHGVGGLSGQAPVLTIKAEFLPAAHDG